MEEIKLDSDKFFLYTRDRYAPAILIKFIHQKYLYDLLKGKVFFNTLKYYKSIENDTGNSVIGDKFEGYFPKDTKLAVKISNNNFQFIDEFLDENISPYVESGIFLSCYYTPLFENIGNNDNYYKICIPKEVIKAMTGDYSNTYKIVIMNGPIFANSIVSYCNQNSICVHHGNVIYDNLLFKENRFIFNAFHKRNKYSYQNEYRFIINDKDKEDQPFKFKVKNDYVLGVYDFIKDEDMKIDVSIIEKMDGNIFIKGLDSNFRKSTIKL